MDTYTKLGILADAAKYDAACTSSGVERGPARGRLGVATNAGCCHSFTADGRCVTLLKVLMSNACTFDCAYCVNRRSNTCPRATFTPRELAELTVDFYKRNYIEGLFLSSGVLGTPDATTERMIECLRILRDELLFNGYVHAKAIPGTSPELLDALGRYADRLSVNIELPSSQSLEALCPDKESRDVVRPMSQIASTIADEHRLLTEARTDARKGSAPAAQLARRTGTGLARRAPAAPGGPRPFSPAGQATQLIVGATPENDNHILTLANTLYERFSLKRIFFSAYVPVVQDSMLPSSDTPVPLRREHRLYQADWLMRYYDFTPDELVSPEAPFLDLEVDPKLAWALTHLERFPLEVNEASKADLLRVPGIGPTGVRRIIRARRSRTLDFDDLKRLRITLKRARHFLTCSGRTCAGFPLDPELIRRRVVEDARSSSYNRTRKQIEGQLTLF